MSSFVASKIYREKWITKTKGNNISNEQMNIFLPSGKPVKVWLSMAIQSFTNIKESNMVSPLAWFEYSSAKWFMNGFICQSVSLQSVSQSASQSISQSVSPSVSQSVSVQVNQSVSQPVSQSVGQPSSQPVSQSVSQSVSQPASQPVSQSASHPASQPASQSVSQSVSQSAS